MTPVIHIECFDCLDQSLVITKRDFRHKLFCSTMDRKVLVMFNEPRHTGKCRGFVGFGIATIRGELQVFVEGDL